MSGYQTSTLVIAGSLALVTLWHAQIPQDVIALLATNENTSGVDLPTAGKTIGLDLLAVAVLVFLAGLSDDAGKIAVAIAVALWLMYGIHSVAVGSTENAANKNL